jgi:hypothetical protein
MLLLTKGKAARRTKIIERQKTKAVQSLTRLAGFLLERSEESVFSLPTLRRLANGLQ